MPGSFGGTTRGAGDYRLSEHEVETTADWLLYNYPNVFSDKYFSLRRMRLFVRQSHCETKWPSRDEKNPLVLWRKGEEIDHCYLILGDGPLDVEVSSQNFVSECGPWTLLGVEALTDPLYKPDFTLRVMHSVRLLRMNRADHARFMSTGPGVALTSHEHNANAAASLGEAQLPDGVEVSNQHPRRGSEPILHVNAPSVNFAPTKLEHNQFGKRGTTKRDTTLFRPERDSRPRRTRSSIPEHAPFSIEKSDKGSWAMARARFSVGAGRSLKPNASKNKARENLSPNRSPNSH